jgi:hypothetical protein
LAIVAASGGAPSSAATATSIRRSRRTDTGARRSRWVQKSVKAKGEARSSSQPAAATAAAAARVRPVGGAISARRTAAVAGSSRNARHAA